MKSKYKLVRVLANIACVFCYFLVNALEKLGYRFMDADFQQALLDLENTSTVGEHFRRYAERHPDGMKHYRAILDGRFPSYAVWYAYRELMKQLTRHYRDYQKEVCKEAVHKYAPRLACYMVYAEYVRLYANCQVANEEMMRLYVYMQRFTEILATFVLYAISTLEDNPDELDLITESILGEMPYPT